MKSGYLGADRNYTKPISHSGDLNNKTEQSSRSYQQAQIPSLKGPASCIISREGLRLYSLLGKLRGDLNSASTATSGKKNMFRVLKYFNLFRSYCHLPLRQGSYPNQKKIAYFLTGLKDNLSRAKTIYTASDYANSQH